MENPQVVLAGDKILARNSKGDWNDAIVLAIQGNQYGVKFINDDTQEIIGPDAIKIGTPGKWVQLSMTSTTTRRKRFSTEAPAALHALVAANQASAANSTTSDQPSPPEPKSSHSSASYSESHSNPMSAESTSFSTASESSAKSPRVEADPVEKPNTTKVGPTEPEKKTGVNSTAKTDNENNTATKTESGDKPVKRSSSKRNSGKKKDGVVRVESKTKTAEESQSQEPVKTVAKKDSKLKLAVSEVKSPRTENKSKAVEGSDIKSPRSDKKTKASDDSESKSDKKSKTSEDSELKSPRKEKTDKKTKTSDDSDVKSPKTDKTLKKTKSVDKPKVTDTNGDKKPKTKATDEQDIKSPKTDKTDKTDKQPKVPENSTKTDKKSKPSLEDSTIKSPRTEKSTAKTPRDEGKKKPTDEAVVNSNSKISIKTPEIDPKQPKDQTEQEPTADKNPKRKSDKRKSDKSKSDKKTNRKSGEIKTKLKDQKQTSPEKTVSEPVKSDPASVPKIEQPSSATEKPAAEKPNIQAETATVPAEKSNVSQNDKPAINSAVPSSEDRPKVPPLKMAPKKGGPKKSLMPKMPGLKPPSQSYIPRPAEEALISPRSAAAAKKMPPPPSIDLSTSTPTPRESVNLTGQILETSPGSNADPIRSAEQPTQTSSTDSTKDTTPTQINVNPPVDAQPTGSLSPRAEISGRTSPIAVPPKLPSKDSKPQLLLQSPNNTSTLAPKTSTPPTSPRSPRTGVFLLEWAFNQSERNSHMAVGKKGTSINWRNEEWGLAKGTAPLMYPKQFIEVVRVRGKSQQLQIGICKDNVKIEQSYKNSILSPNVIPGTWETVKIRRSKANDIIGLYIDMDAKSFTLFVNGTPEPEVSFANKHDWGKPDPITNAIFPFFCIHGDLELHITPMCEVQKYSTLVWAHGNKSQLSSGSRNSKATAFFDDLGLAKYRAYLDKEVDLSTITEGDLKQVNIPLVPRKIILDALEKEKAEAKNSENTQQ